MSFDRATFYDALRHGALFDRGLSARQVQGTEAIFNAWDKSGHADERWLAYILGTTYHETGRAMFPVCEGGKGKGHPYGVANARGQVGYGRGFVQLTWNGPAPKPDNYARADKALDLGGKLIANNDLALQPDVAAQIIIRGMTEAWFTSFKLADYLNDHLADYLHARRIVNGMDKAETIAGYALTFYAAIQAGAHKAADHTAVAVAKPAAATSPDPLSALADAIEHAAELIPAGGSSPAAPVPSSATTESNPMEAVLPVIEGLFSGVVGKLGVASSVAAALPHLVEGTISNISEIPKVIADINTLVADVKAGKWSDIENAVEAVITEFGNILSNYGVSLTGLTKMVDALPAAPAVTAAKA